MIGLFCHALAWACDRVEEALYPIFYSVDDDPFYDPLYDDALEGE